MKTEPANVADWPKFKVGDVVIADGAKGSKNGKRAKVEKVDTLDGKPGVHVLWEDGTESGAFYWSWRFRLADEPAPEVTPTAPGPRKPPPALPPEIHSTVKFDANRAWEATMALARSPV